MPLTTITKKYHKKLRNKYPKFKKTIDLNFAEMQTEILLEYEKITQPHLTNQEKFALMTMAFSLVLFTIYMTLRQYAIT